MKKHILTSALALCAPVLAAYADDAHTTGKPFLSRPDGHGPIGVMGDHMHKKGDLMLSYRYMRMEMDGTRQGTHSVTPQQVLGSYMMTPLTMQMDMHMVGAMYGLTDTITLMAMVPYIEKKMETLHRNGTRASNKSSGVGDIKATVLKELWSGGKHTVHGQAGLTLPTGSIDQSTTNGTPMAYGMQLGSGTWDILGSLTYTGHTDDLSWGAQGSTMVRTGLNDNGYRLGNTYSATAWLARPITDNISLSGRLIGTHTNQIRGRHSRLNAAMMPGADATNSGGNTVDAGFGINFLTPNTPKGHRLALEATVPVYRNLQGTQLEKDYTLILGWQKSF